MDAVLWHRHATTASPPAPQVLPPGRPAGEADGGPGRRRARRARDGARLGAGRASRAARAAGTPGVRRRASVIPCHTGAVVTGTQDDLHVDLQAVTTLSGDVLKHRLRLLAGSHWQLRDVTAA